MDLSKNNSELVRAAWTAMDQTYGTVAPGYSLQPIDNGGQGRIQPWETPAGFIVMNQVTESSGSGKVVFYKNPETNTVMLVPMGTNGNQDSQGWWSNSKDLGLSQWQAMREDVFTIFRDDALSNGERPPMPLNIDENTKIVFVGDSKAGAIAQFMLHDIKNSQIQATSDETQPPLAQVSNDNIALITRVSPGIGWEVERMAPGPDERRPIALNDPAFAGISTHHATAATADGSSKEIVNQLGGEMLGGDGMLYVFSEGVQNKGLGYQHRLVEAGYDHMNATGGDFSHMSLVQRPTLDIGSVAALGANIAGAGESTSAGNTEAGWRFGSSLICGLASAPAAVVRDALQGEFNPATAALSTLGSALYATGIGPALLAGCAVGVVGSNAAKFMGDPSNSLNATDTSLTFAVNSTGAPTQPANGFDRHYGRTADGEMYVMDRSDVITNTYLFGHNQKYSITSEANGSVSVATAFNSITKTRDGVTTVNGVPRPDLHTSELGISPDTGNIFVATKDRSNTCLHEDFASDGQGGTVTTTSRFEAGFNSSVVERTVTHEPSPDLTSSQVAQLREDLGLPPLAPSPTTGSSTQYADAGHQGGTATATDAGPQGPAHAVNPGYTDTHDPTDASSSEAQNGQDLASDQASAQQDAQQAAQATQAAQAAKAAQDAQDAATGANVLNTLLTLGKWDDLGDLQRAGALLGAYNIAAGHSNGALGTVPSPLVAGLGLLAALDSGDEGAILVGSLQLLDAATATATAAGIVADTLGSDFIPGVNLLLALESGNPYSIASSAMSMVGAMLAIPGLQILAVFVALASTFQDQPAVEGTAAVTWNDAGQLASTVTHSAEGGGANAQSALDKLLNGLNDIVASHTDDAGNPLFAINPAKMPQIGYVHDADGNTWQNMGGASLSLTWTDERGQSVTRYYDASGNRENGQNINKDFALHAQEAVIPSWLAEQARGQYQPHIDAARADEARLAALQQEADALAPKEIRTGQGETMEVSLQGSPDPARYQELQTQIAQTRASAQHARQQAGDTLASLPSLTELGQHAVKSQDGNSQSLTALTLTLPSIPLDGNAQGAQGNTQATQANTQKRQVLLNTDSDAYLEKTDWVQANQAVLGIDLDGDGKISARELLTGDLAWLDANGDGRLDARDPAFAAIKLWNDVNGDGQSLKPKLNADGQVVKDAQGNTVYESETQSLGKAGITGIDFASGQAGGKITVQHADGTQEQAGAQVLHGESRGVLYSAATGGAKGVVETSEQEDGSGHSVLLASNTRAFDGKAEHRHGGDLAAGIAAEQDSTIDAGDSRLHSTSSKTVQSTTVQTATKVGKGDARIHRGEEGDVIRGQDSGQTAASATAAQVVSNAKPGTAASAGAPSGAYPASHPASHPAPHHTSPPRETVLVQGPATSPQAGAAAGTPTSTSTSATISVPTPAVLSGQVAGAQAQGAGAVKQSGAVGQTVAGQSAGTQGAQAATQIAGNGQTFIARPPSAQPIVVNLGSGRIQSDAPYEGARRPVVFVPGAAAAGVSSGAASLAQQRQGVTDGMIRAADAGLFGAGGGVNGANNGALMALAIGAGAAQWAGPAMAGANRGPLGDRLAASPSGAAAGVSHGASGTLQEYTGNLAYPGDVGAEPPMVFRQVEPSRLRGQGPQGSQDPHNLSPQKTHGATAAGHAGDAGDTSAMAILASGWTSAIPNSFAASPGGKTPATPAPAKPATGASSFSDEAPHIPFPPVASDPQGGAPSPVPHTQLQSANAAPLVLDESAAGLEDTWLWIAPADLLANDSDVEDGHAQLSINAVGPAAHGTVSLQGGRILFKPDANYHGPASFAYTVTDRDGASSQGTAHLQIAPVNDAPLALGEETDAREGEGLVFAPAVLLANDTDAEGDPLHISRVGEAVHGAVSLDADGQVRFVPESDYHGPAAFTYWVADSSGAETAATVHINFASVNDAPLVLGETIFSDEDASLVIDPAALLVNDLDIDGPHSALQITAVGSAVHGTVALLPSGAIFFTPEEDYVGTASFAYTVSDGAGGHTVAIAKVELAGVNDAPRLVGETIAGTEDTPLQIARGALLANDSDVDSPQASLTITAVGNATHGAVVLNPDGSIHFTPDANYNASKGPATFEYTVADGDGGTTTGVATLNIAPVNDAPIATGEIAAPADEDTVLSFTPASLLANETDVDNTLAQLSVSAVNNAVHGTVVLAADGSVTFTPELNYSGEASFSYTVSDGAGGLAQATVAMQFKAVNDAPTLVNDLVAATEDTAVLVASASLLANDNDVDTPKAQLSVTAVGDARHGTVALQADGQIRFTPDANFNGTASFSYTVSDGMGGTSVATAQVQVGAVNDLPTSQDDALPEQVEDTNLLILAQALLANDTDVDTASGTNAAAQVLRIGSVSAIAGQTHGSVRLDASGNVQFVPEQDYAGPVAFAYTVTDGAGGVSTSTVRFTVANVNDTPVLASDLLSAKNQTSITIAPGALLANDMDPDTPVTGEVLTVTSVSGAQHGSVVLQADGNILFTPDAGFLGVAQFTYEVSDGHGGASTAVAEVNTLNLAPVATGETVTIQEDSVTTIAQSLLLANDTDADNAAADLHIVGVGSATHGSVALNAAGDVVFTPDLNYFGAAQFTYTVADGDGGQSTATAQVNVQSVNDAPLVVGETATFEEDQIAVFSQASLLANDTDIETPGALSIAAVGNASGGTVQLVGGQVQFTPWANHEGAASFTYTVSDGHGGLTQAAVSMQFSPVNDAPVVNSESFNGQQDTAYTFSNAALLANDTDAETPAGLFITNVWGAQNATVTMTAGGIEFTPTPGFSGAASFNYTVSDAQGATSYGTTTVNVVRANHNPVAVDDSFLGSEDMPFNIGLGQLLANDSDPDAPYSGDQLSITAVSGAVNGTVSLVAGSHVLFTPDAEYSGAAQFNYAVSDGKGGVTTATAYLTVNAVNDAPVVDSVSYDPRPDASGVYSTGGGAEGGFEYQDRDMAGRQNGSISAHDIDSAGGFAYSIAQGPIHGHASVDAHGNWLYESEAVDPYRGSDAFTVRVTDSGGASTLVDVAGRHDEMAPVPVNGYGGSSFTAFSEGSSRMASVAGDVQPQAQQETQEAVHSKTSPQPLVVVVDDSLEVVEVVEVVEAVEGAGEDSGAVEIAPASLPATDADIAQQALLLNSWSNTATAEQPPLAFVPSNGAIEIVVDLPAQLANLGEAANDQAASAGALPIPLVAVG